MIPQLEKYLKVFYHQVARSMADMEPKHQQDGTWVYPPIGAALEIMGLDYIRVYIARRQNTIEQ